ncbi:DUF5107 domain-containing protein [Amycolatopsis sp. FBCC-B4732]|uniref:DUF5107 domain-containing protein n=1 Tax=Amycolatopsis sp. FBCC-B4732 TaxID=3079339 RepID=UPI001FF1DDE6|nr:DUF5107 domain-containing protein [Amycolatopsis sp. FBCC-B4732]UOX85890.1 DUF5107 domain-containing protein [Amycolatopsis sp. FBCC-B4732]
MTELRRTSLTLPAAELGPENPLPPLVPPEAVASVSNVDELPADLAAGLAYGRLGTVLPCRLQDGYSRERSVRELPALVLENDHLRATVLPSLGGRLWSLVHKPSGRELLYRNPVFQPANLALRDAWFAGGVEWNLGSTGHTTLTCAPMFAAAVEGPDGTPVLRLWEWERTRDLPYQLDFWLPDDSEQLLVGVRIRNPHSHDVPVYWWSNTAVPQTPSTRVLVPADQAWHYGYSGRLDLVGVPGELTYPARGGTAADYFFEVASDRPWIAAVDETGAGLGQASTARLRGRKLFRWGESAGGRHWQEWLAPGAGTGYLEIQAGLARTQLEHLRLPPGEAWDWLEAYGPVSADPAAVHGENWRAATDAVAARLPPVAVLEARHRAWRAIADAEPGEPLATGSGWGALETLRMVACLPGTPFPKDTLGPEQRPWLDLLDGETPQGDPRVPPPSTLVNRYWAELLEYTTDTWLTWYHRGVARWAAGDREAAQEAWRASVAAAENAWALRNLAVAATDPEESARLFRRALALAPDVRPLLAEALSAQLAAGHAPVSLLPGRPEGRLALLTAHTRLAAGDRAGAKAVFDAGFEIPNIREGELSLSDTWEALSADPLPSAYDFRMK